MVVAATRSLKLFNTANGVRSGRMVVANEVRLASLAVRGLRVGTGLTGETDTEALLGQNFLRHFDVEIRSDQMLIHPRGKGKYSGVQSGVFQQPAKANFYCQEVSIQIP